MTDAYGALLTYLCQSRQADLFSFLTLAPDPVAAQRRVLERSLQLGDRLACDMARFVEPPHTTSTTPPPILVPTDGQRKRALVVRRDAALPTLEEALSKTDVVVLDQGRGTRLGATTAGGSSKGAVPVGAGLCLADLATAGAARWVDALRRRGHEFVALTSCDQVVAPAPGPARAAEAQLEARAVEGAEVIFFDGPPALALARLAPILDRTWPPTSNETSTMALVRHRKLLAEYSGAHVYACALIRRDLAIRYLPPLLADDSSEASGGLVKTVTTLVSWPSLVRVRWPEGGSRETAARTVATLRQLHNGQRHIGPVNAPIDVVNVNTPAALRRVRQWIADIGE